MNEIETQDDFLSVSGGNSVLAQYIVDNNLILVPAQAGTVSVGDVEQVELVNADCYDALQKIDYKFSFIIFLVLVFWLHKNIRNSVRRFVGRGAND